jgi:hypothetical protein
MRILKASSRMMAVQMRTIRWRWCEECGGEGA